MAKQRNIRIDIIKAVGIICVVLGHTEVMPSAGFVNLFHVGLFFIASGIFYKESYTDTAAGVGTVIVKRIKRLYIPFVLYNLFFLCFRNALTAAGFLDGMILDRNGILRQVFGIVKLTSGEVLPGPDWFIRALFILEVLYTLVDFLIKKICGKRYHIGRWVVSAGLLGLGYFLCVNKVMLATNYFTIPLDLGTICSSWILFTAGFELPAVLKKFKAKWNTVKDILLMLACFVILCVMMRFGGISYADNYYPNIPYFLIAAAAGFGFSYGLAGLLEKTPSLIKRFFVFTGGVTLEILMMHLLGFKIVTFIIYKTLNLGRAALASFPVYSADYWIAYLITGMAFSLVFAFVWGKIKESLKTRLGVKRFIVYLVMAVIFAVVPNMLLDRIHAYNAAHPDYSLVFDKDYYLEQGYPYNASVGLEGVEKAFESQLHGTNGVRVTVRSEDGQVIDSYYQEEPKAGNNVCLTIDLNCQQVVEDALSSEIEKINRNRIQNAGAGEEVQLAKSGAAVLIQVGTGDLLAAASYPTYDLSNYSRDFAQLISDPARPMFNRAFQGTYAPGSTFKVVTATAGLKEGAISADTKIYDRGIIDEYEGYTYTCWIYPGSHGTINVREALQVSCNYFFYIVGRTVGIDVLDRYAANYGLGQATGIELYEEKGSLASKEYKESVIGESWYVGDTLQASIGQSYHLFTPLQLASYAATIAADGKRYGVHILRSVMSADNGTVLDYVSPEIQNRYRPSESGRGK